MPRLLALKKAETKVELAAILGVKASFLTHTLYVKDPANQYYQFIVPKKSGGHRIINAPTDELKDLQARLSMLLLDCIDEINDLKKIDSTLSHGFVRNKSIITNAFKHVNQKNVLNLDLSDFFDSFNFGRVRGFFIKNNNFKLNENIATVIAQIACLNNKLPQGSPCSPVITNLITHSLDIRLAKLAESNSCIYTRYADDITFSTRKSSFSTQLVVENENVFQIGKLLRKEIKRAGFFINNKKTRVQYKDSRQDVTGLVVNTKVNIKSDYWRETRAMCHNIFMTGSYTTVTGKGSVSELDGRMNFIDSIDKHNNLKAKGPEDRRFAFRNHGLDYRQKLNVREKTYSKFLYYKYFYANEKPMILCEGKTDNIYLKSAINILAGQYALLGTLKTKTEQYKLNVDFLEYTKKTRYLLDLFGGGVYLKKFVERFENNYGFYKAPKPKCPVILLLDNDTGPDQLLNFLQKEKSKFPNCPNIKEDMRKTGYIHLLENLYVILTPQNQGNNTDMEAFFDKATHNIIVNGKKFDPSKDGDTLTTYGKNTFATKVVKAKKSQISFQGFIPILNQIESVIKDYNTRV
jgi:retron-type reverse transcriptase